MEHSAIYLDHNATTPLHPRVKEAMTEAFEVFGNPSSLHSIGRRAHRLIEEARAQIALLIGAQPDEIVFVGSGSEANNTVLSMVACSSDQCRGGPQPRPGIVTSTIEHPCILETARCLRHRGSDIAFVEVDSSGRVPLEALSEAITPNVGLVSVMMANNETGTMQNIPKIAALAHERGALFHTDAVQAVGKVPVDVRALDVDFLALSGHKIYGPKGIGVLYVRKGTPFCPLLRGGHQERGRRAGTENTIGIVGLGMAAKLRLEEMPDEIPRIDALREALHRGIEDRIPDILFNGHPSEHMPNTLNVSFLGIEGEAILLYLDLEGVAVSTGSACASGSLDPSHVLLAMGLSAEQAHGSIRISLGRGTTAEEVEQVLEILPRVIEKTRRISSAYGGNTS